jgi:hypothetical protein
MQTKSGIRRAATICLLALSGAGCSMVSSVISTGARSAVVVATNADGSPAAAPPREEMKALLSQHFLWLADDKRGAQWIAFVEVYPSTSPLQAQELTFVRMEKNPAWRPLEVSTPVGNLSQPGFRDMNSWSVSQSPGRLR